jgi:hypothetical protein
MVDGDQSSNDLHRSVEDMRHVTWRVQAKAGRRFMLRIAFWV